MLFGWVDKLWSVSKMFFKKGVCGDITIQEIWDTERQLSEIWGCKLQSLTGWLDSEGFKSTGTTEWVAG